MPAPRPPGSRKEPLPAIVGALVLDDVALIDQLLENAARATFGDLEDVEQIGNLHSRIAIDEMQNAMMGATETELRQHFIRIADKIPIGEEQQLDEIQVWLTGGRAPEPPEALGDACWLW